MFHLVILSLEIYHFADDIMIYKDRREFSC